MERLPKMSIPPGKINVEELRRRAYPLEEASVVAYEHIKSVANSHPEGKVIVQVQDREDLISPYLSGEKMWCYLPPPIQVKREPIDASEALAQIRMIQKVRPDCIRLFQLSGFVKGHNDFFQIVDPDGVHMYTFCASCRGFICTPKDVEYEDFQKYHRGVGRLCKLAGKGEALHTHCLDANTLNNRVDLNSLVEGLLHSCGVEGARSHRDTMRVLRGMETREDSARFLFVNEQKHQATTASSEPQTLVAQKKIDHFAIERKFNCRTYGKSKVLYEETPIKEASPKIKPAGVLKISDPFHDLHMEISFDVKSCLDDFMVSGADYRGLTVGESPGQSILLDELAVASMLQISRQGGPLATLASNPAAPLPYADFLTFTSKGLSESARRAVAATARLAEQKNDDNIVVGRPEGTDEADDFFNMILNE